jgi:poly-gamma-glutamate capsule biosynthesis protein CapA/YwtB (metallophosphatase superfamily)
VILLALALPAWSGPYEDGVAALKEGRAGDAEALLARAAAAAPTTPGPWWELGFARWAQGKWAGAAEAWAKVAAIDAHRADLAFWLPAAQTRARLATLPIPAAPIPEQPEGPTLSFVAVGDTMMGSDLKRGAAGLAPDPSVLFPHVTPILRGADVAFVNLEGPIADDLPSTKCGPQSTSCYAFRTPTRYAPALVDAGFDLASLANNHAWDLGPPGQYATMATLDRIGIAHSGPFGDVGRIERGGKVVALVAAHSGECCLNVNELDEIRRAIGEADTWADLVVFSYHGGAEGAGARHVPKTTEIAWGERRGDVHALAHAAIDAGADLVVGHGPHASRHGGVPGEADRLLARQLHGVPPVRNCRRLWRYDRHPGGRAGRERRARHGPAAPDRARRRVGSPARSDRSRVGARARALGCRLPRDGGHRGTRRRARLEALREGERRPVIRRRRDGGWMATDDRAPLFIG